MREIKTPPQSVVDENGKFNWGCYNGPIRNVNMLDADLGFTSYKNFMLREWQACQMYSEDGWFVMMAIYNTKKVCIVQFIIYNVLTQQKWRYEKKVLPGSMSVPDGLFDTECTHRSRGFDFRIYHNVEAGRLDIKVSIKNFRKLPDLRAELRASHNVNTYNPIVVCLPFSEKKGMYSHKALMPLFGEVSFGSENITFQKANSSLILDDHKGYYPYPTKYDWITGLGFDSGGRRIGFNLTDNQVKDQENYNENCLWLDGAMHPLPPIKVSRPNGYKGEWFVSDSEGMVDLKFTPEVHNSVRMNLGLIVSRYEGPYGFFEGCFNLKDEEKVPISHIFGMGEDFYLKT